MTQALNRRFYHLFACRVLQTVQIAPGCDEFLHGMRSESGQTKVMIFNRQPYFYKLSPETDYKWISHPIVVKDASRDMTFPEAEWSKIVRVDAHKWLFFMGAQRMNNNE